MIFLEVGARVYFAFRGESDPTPLKWYKMDENLGWDRQPGFTGPIYGRVRFFSPSGLPKSQEADLAENPERPLVVALGDSCTYGWDLSADQAYLEVLHSRLPETNVLNLALIGYSSYQGLRSLLKYGLEKRPAAIIVGFNFNDRRYVLPPDEPDGRDRFERLMRPGRLGRLASDVRLLDLMANLMGRPLRANQFDDESSEIKLWRSDARGVDVRQLPARVGPDAYRANLLEIARLGREAKSKVIFVGMLDRPEDKRPLAEAAAAAKAGNLDEARKILEPCMAMDQVSHAIARRELAQYYSEAGRQQEADAVALIDHPPYTMLGGGLLYRDTQYHEIMREVAATTDSEFVDAGAMMQARPGVYIDFVHFNAEGQQIIAEALEPIVRRALDLPTSATVSLN